MMTDTVSFSSSPFFVTFWQMTLYDLLYPKERYDAEVSRLKGLQREAATNTSLQAADRDSFIAKIIDLATKLMAEMGRHFSASRGATRRLEKEKDHWFEGPYSPELLFLFDLSSPFSSRLIGIQTRDDRARLVQDILQYCVEPRARLSLPDAVFAYQMIKRLHSMNTAGFHTIVFFDQLLTSQVSPTLFSCTENEARNYGKLPFFQTRVAVSC
jgi:THO complex subunit 2